LTPFDLELNSEDKLAASKLTYEALLG
jgi:hypothetical protein